jgi:hypothetical protein
MKSKIGPKVHLYWWKSGVYKVWKPPKYPPTLWKIREISHFSKTWSTPTPSKNENLRQRGWKRDASHNSPMVLFIAKTKRLECPYGVKGILQLIRGSLIWLSLCLTQRHRTNHLLLHFHATSVVMPRVPSAIAPSLVLRQNWETLTRLASRRSKPPNIDACAHIVFIRSSVLRCKPTNLLPLGFEAWTKKPSRWFWGPNHQTVDLGF